MKKMAKRDVAKVVDEDFSSVFEIIARRRNRALMAVNVELLMTNWEIGAFLSPRIHAGSWDAAVVGRLADYLKRQDPTLRGYGKSNLYNMAKVYDVFSSDAFSVLNERHQKQLTAGLDFFQLPTGKSDSDLLFYHRGLQCLVAFELKTRKFHPKDLGQLEFYLEALDRDVKKENENPSIGIILCKSANKIVVEYAMSRTMSPVMVAQYKRQLIPKEVLQRTFEEYLALPETIEG